MNYQKYFKDKKITVMGLGLLGRGVGDVEFLAQQGAILTVTDLKTEEELSLSLEKLKTYDISYVLGKHQLEDFIDCDMVLKAAGVPLDSPFIAEARKNKIPVEMSTSLFAKFSPATIVGVTGTRGKSTVAAMIFEILSKVGKKTFFGLNRFKKLVGRKTLPRKVFLGGNIRGVSTLAHLPESTEGEIVVLELDSWQLQGFGEEKLSPNVSVFTTFYPDHLNYYGGDLDIYLRDKSNIFKFQSEKDTLILGSQCAELIRKKYPDIKSKIIIPQTYDISYVLKVPGEHNRYNAALAAAASRALGIGEDTIKKALENFKEIEGRLELMREINGVTIYNDTTATTPEATLAALNALGQEGNKNIILIIGGADKGLDFTRLLEALLRFCKAVILIPGTGTDKIRSKVKSQKSKVIETSNLKEAAQKAMKMAEKGDIILFSPAFASFGSPPVGFKNEFDRGDRFKEIVEKLTENAL